MFTKLTCVGCLLIVLGCGALTKKSSIPKEQMDKDIAAQVVDVQEGSEKTWIFEADDQRCFTVVDQESKYTDSSADVTVNVGSWQDMSMDGTAKYIAVFGKMLMKYEKSGDKWVVKSVQSKDLISKTLDTEQFKKFVDIQMPLCRYSRFLK